MLDLLATDRPDLLSCISVTDPISDHCCVLATFRLSCLPAKKTVMRRYNYSAADWPGLRSCLEHVPLEEVIAGTEDVNAAWSAWESRFLDIIRHYIPCHTITVRRKNKVWMNSTLHKLSRKKHRLFKRFQHTKRQADWQKYKDFKNFCNAEFTRHKKQYYTILYPCKKIKHISRKPPWLSDLLLAECKLKSRLFHLSKMQPTEENSKKYRAQRNRVTALIRRAKKDFASSFDDICGRQNGPNLWSLMKKLRKKSNNDNLPDLLTPNNTLATTDKEKANTLNNFFLSQSSTDSPSDPIYKLCPPPLPTSARLCEIQVSPAEVYSALSSLKEKKSSRN